MELSGSGFLLRGWERGDERSLALHANNPKIAHNLGAFFPSPYTIEDAQDWVSQNSPPADPHLNFAIVVEGEAAGGIGIHPQSGVHSCKGSLGYWLGEAHWGRGIAHGDAVRSRRRRAGRSGSRAAGCGGALAQARRNVGASRERTAGEA